MNIYRTTDGRFIRSAKPISWTNKRCMVDVRHIPSNNMTDFDLLTPISNELLMQAKDRLWLAPGEAAALQKHNDYQNYCIRLNETIYIHDGMYIPFEELVKQAQHDEKKVILSRLAHQLCHCHTVLHAESGIRPGDAPTPATEKILNSFYTDKCIQAQRRYARSSMTTPTDLCVWMDETIYISINENGKYKKLSTVLHRISTQELDRMLARLSEIAANLHSVITAQDSAA